MIDKVYTLIRIIAIHRDGLSGSGHSRTVHGWRKDFVSREQIKPINYFCVFERRIWYWIRFTFCREPMYVNKNIKEHYLRKFKFVVMLNI